MGRYVVVKFFTDLQDNKHPYRAGDIFPRAGLDVSKERLEELSGNKNRQKTPLIKLESDVESEQKSEQAPAKDEVSVKPKRRRTRK